MSVAVVIAYRPDGTELNANTFDWVRARWWHLLPEAEHIVSDSDPVYPFSHAQALNLGAKAAPEGSTLLLVDADTTPSSAHAVAEALAVAEDGGWGLLRWYMKLTRSASTVLRDGDHTQPTIDGDFLDPVFSEWQGDACSWAGLVAVNREAFLDVGGYDERIPGWGPDDICLGLKLDVLLRPHTRVPGAVLHFWHPTTYEDAATDRKGIDMQHTRPYFEAAELNLTDPTAARAAMRALIEETP